MLRSFIPAVLVWSSLLASSGCKESNPLPPGNWQGRCAADPNQARDYGPPPTKFVRDEAQILTTKFAAELDEKLSAFQRESCHQLLVVSVASVHGGSLANHALEYANRIGLGYRRLNNGLMLVIAPSSHEARIQIGCGLEDVISDAQANDVLRHDLLPALKESSWEVGLRASLNTLMNLARKKTIDEQFRPQGCRQHPAASK